MYDIQCRAVWYGNIRNESTATHTHHIYSASPIYFQPNLIALDKNTDTAAPVRATNCRV